MWKITDIPQQFIRSLQGPAWRKNNGVQRQNRKYVTKEKQYNENVVINARLIFRLIFFHNRFFFSPSLCDIFVPCKSTVLSATPKLCLKLANMYTCKEFCNDFRLFRIEAAILQQYLKIKTKKMQRNILGRGVFYKNFERFGLLCLYFNSVETRPKKISFWKTWRYMKNKNINLKQKKADLEMYVFYLSVSLGLLLKQPSFASLQKLKKQR